jgi:cytidine deaminase
MADHTELIQAALAARELAHAPFSKFPVGAALRTSDGATITGANVESASYGLSCCAERIAIFKALTDGHTNFTSLAIASPGGAAPCGACRQVIAEQAPTATLILIDSNHPDTATETNITTLLPNSFTADDLPTDN